MEWDEHVELKPGQMYNPRRGKIQCFMDNFRQGRRDRFPICCILRFCFDAIWLDGKVLPKEKGMAQRRGSVIRGNNVNDVFVPCNIFHHKNHEWTEDWY